MYDGMLLERELESRYKGQDEADLNDVALHEAYCTPGRRLVTRAGAGGMMLPRYGRQRRPRIDLRGGERMNSPRRAPTSARQACRTSQSTAYRGPNDGFDLVQVVEDTPTSPVPWEPLHHGRLSSYNTQYHNRKWKKKEGEK